MSKKFIYKRPSFEVDLLLAKAASEGADRLVLKLPEYEGCDHGVVFDEAAAKKLLEEAPVDKTMDPALAFIMGSSASGEIRKRWPRLDGTCPKGCGFYGAAYASYAHYIYGDW